MILLLLAFLLPDPLLTPGVARPLTVKQVCSITWGKDVRHVSDSLKKRVCDAYGARACPGPRWELDHLISRELGGADEAKNLWPQRIGEARVKDRIENWLHRQVCARKIGLENAQRGIAKDWRQYAHDVDQR